MGFRISWLAVEGGKAPLLAALGLADTGEPDEVNETPLSIAELATGWTVLWANDEAYADEALAARLVALGPVLIVHVNETCMHSTASLIDRIGRRWRVHHEGDERIDWLEIDGEPPAGTDSIVAAARAEQAAEDVGAAAVDFIFDVPLNVAKALCGFKHDVLGMDGEALAFTAVMSVTPPRG